jgi:hypothetical protein
MAPVWDVDETPVALRQKKIEVSDGGCITDAGESDGLLRVAVNGDQRVSPDSRAIHGALNVGNRTELLNKLLAA